MFVPLVAKPKAGKPGPDRAVQSRPLMRAGATRPIIQRQAQRTPVSTGSAGGTNATPTVAQPSPLALEARAVWAADSTIENLLWWLSRPEVKADPDTDLDREIAVILDGRPNDLWVAQRIRKGQLGETTGAFGPKEKGKPKPRPVSAYFVRGTTNRRALVIGGVHGTERSGIEVANMLLADVQPPNPPPAFTVIIVPTLFPDNAARGPGHRERRDSGPTKETPQATRDAATETNRNFPNYWLDLAGARAAGGGVAKDALGEEILPENIMLLELIERFRPERIISIHGSRYAGAAGVSYDPRKVQPGLIEAARQLAALLAPLTPGEGFLAGLPPLMRPFTGQEALAMSLIAQAAQQADAADKNLALKTATLIHDTTEGIKGRGDREFWREDEASGKQKYSNKDKENRSRYPSVAGNVGAKGKLDYAMWSGSKPKGVSLGGYASGRGISIFTVEPPLYRNSEDYRAKGDEIEKADRHEELMAYAKAVRTILLGAP